MKIQTWDRASIFSENHERIFPKMHVLHQSPLSQQHPAVSQNDTNASLFNTGEDFVRAQVSSSQVSCVSDQNKKTKSEPKRRRHHDSPRPGQQEFVSIQIQTIFFIVSDTSHNLCLFNLVDHASSHMLVLVHIRSQHLYTSSALCLCCTFCLLAQGPP